VRPEADTPNRTVRSVYTPPERRFFKPDPLRASSNPLNYRAFNIRTKMAVVRLLRRKWAERDEKRPELGLEAAARGSDKWPENPAFCGFSFIPTVVEPHVSRPWDLRLTFWCAQNGDAGPPAHCYPMEPRPLPRQRWGPFRFRPPPGVRFR
jgi:hypothetical protein